MSQLEHVAEIIPRVLHRWGPTLFEYGWSVCRCADCGIARRFVGERAEYWRDGRKTSLPPPCRPAV